MAAATRLLAVGVLLSGVDPGPQQASKDQGAAWHPMAILARPHSLEPSLSQPTAAPAAAAASSPSCLPLLHHEPHPGVPASAARSRALSPRRLGCGRAAGIRVASSAHPRPACSHSTASSSSPASLLFSAQIPPAPKRIADFMSARSPASPSPGRPSDTPVPSFNSFRQPATSIVKLNQPTSGAQHVRGLQSVHASRLH